MYILNGKKMNKSKILLTALIILNILLITNLYARGKKEEAKDSQPKIIQVTGIVRLVGTDLFQDLVITSDTGEWYITNDEKEKLHNLQHRTVTIEGEETVIELKFASGMPAGTRRILRNIVILSVAQ